MRRLLLKLALRLVLSELRRLWSKPEVRTLVRDTVEWASGLDLNEDGKRDHAVDDLRARLKVLGHDSLREVLSIMVEMAHAERKGK